MARIPRHVMVTPSVSGVMPPQGAFGAPAQAMGGLIKAMGGPVDLVYKHLRDAQEVRNKADVREQVREMRQAQADFMQEIQESGLDPAEWAGTWEKRLGQHEASLKGKKFPPVVIEELTGRFQDFAGESMISLSGAALKENLRRARAGVELDHQEFMHNEQFDKAEENILQAVDDGTFDEVTGNAMIQGIRYKREETDMEVHMRLDPVDFIENIDSYDLPSKRKLDTLAKAEQEKARAERREIEMLETLIGGGMIETKEELKAELELDHYRVISDENKKAILKSFANREPLTNADKFAIGDKIHDDFEAFKKGEIDIEEYGKRHDQNQSAIDALGTRGGVGELKSLNYQRSPVHFMREGDEDSPEAARKRAAEMKDPIDRAKQLVRLRARGVKGVSVARALRDDATGALLDTAGVERAEFNAAEAQVAEVFRARMEDEITNWLLTFESGATPTETEMTAFLDKIQPRVVTDLRNERRLAAEGQPIPRPNATPEQTRTRRQSVQYYLNEMGANPVNPLLHDID